MNYSSPSDISADFLKSAGQKVQLTFAQVVVYSLLGGAFIALGGLLAVYVAGGMPGLLVSNPGIVKFVFGAVFPVGLIMVVIGGAQLFTSDCAVLPFGFLYRRISLRQVLVTWTTVYAANFLGAIFIAWMFSYQAGILDHDPWRSFLHKLAVGKTTSTFMTVFVKGIGANWLVCLAVWMSYAAKDVTGKMLAIWVPVMCFVALGMEHSIANMFFIPSAIFLGADVSWIDLVWKNLVPSTLGNIAGGAVLVALPYWFMFSIKRKPVNTPPPSMGGSIKILKDFETRLN